LTQKQYKVCLVLLLHATVLSDRTDEITEREGAELIKRHRARFLRKLPEERSQGSIPASSSGRRTEFIEYTEVLAKYIADESIELTGKLDLDDIETAHIHGTQGGGSPTSNRQAPGVYWIFSRLHRIF
jgi:hypothetical protein